MSNDKLLIDTLSGFTAVAQGNAITDLAIISGDDKASALDGAVAQLQKFVPASVWVITGPGNFTAIRVGIGYARAFAWAHGIASYGVSVFDIDHAHLDVENALHFRDARGGRFYKASYHAHRMKDISLVDHVTDGWSAEGLDGVAPIVNSIESRAHAFARLSVDSEKYTSPATALYVRGANAEPSQEKPLVIFDD